MTIYKFPFSEKPKNVCIDTKEKYFYYILFLEAVNICYSLARRSVLGKTVPRVLSNISVPKTEGKKQENKAQVCLIYLQKILDRKRCWGVLVGPIPSPANNQK